MSAPLRPALREGESDAFSFPALHKKCLGTVFISNQRLRWTATDAQSKVQRVELTWSAVKENLVRWWHLRLVAFLIA